MAGLPSPRAFCDALIKSGEGGRIGGWEILWAACQVKPVSLPEHAQHKFWLQLDGTAASNRLLKLLFMGSVVLKQEIGSSRTHNGNIWKLGGLSL